MSMAGKLKPKQRMGTPTHPDAEVIKDMLLWLREQAISVQAISVTTAGVEISGLVDNRAIGDRVERGKQHTEEERKGIYEQFGGALIGATPAPTPRGGEAELNEPTEEDDDD